MESGIIAALVAVWLRLARLGIYVAGQKGRSAAEGLLFGPLGGLVAALLPTVRPEPKKFRPRPVGRSPWDLPPEGPAEDEAMKYLTDQ